MTDRSRRAANADPAHESEDSRVSGGSPDAREGGGGEQSGDSIESPGGTPGTPGEPGGREDRNGQEGRDGREDNPFAAPPAGEPDKPWQPRHPKGGHGDGSSRWGSQWSRQQPGRHDGGFGGSGGPERPGRPEQGGEGKGGGRRTPGMRWDPTDPKQRHARYALHGGIWGLFFALFGMIEIGLLLGALSVYWGISALRGPSGVGSIPTAQATAADVAGTDRKSVSGPDPAPSGDTRPAGMQVTVTPAQAAKARKTAAVGGLVAGILTLVGVAGLFTQQLVYEEYYTCQQDALTQASREQCDELPEGQVPWWVPMAEDAKNEGLSFPGF